MKSTENAAPADVADDGTAAGQDGGSTDEQVDRRPLWRSPKVIVPIAAIAAIAAVVGIKAGTGGDDDAVAAAPHADASVPGTPVTVGTDVCGQGWTGGKAGRQTFALWNNSIEGMEVYLQDVATRKVYLDVEALGATATRSASADLGPGTYRFFCIPEESEPLTGPEEKLTGTYDGPVTAGVVPITPNDLAPALRSYLDWVRGQLPTLKRQAQAVADDVRRGDRDAAERDWLTAHRTYETLGAAYDAFGDDDTAINAVPSTTVPAAQDDQLTGFHRVEALLWSGAPMARIRQPAAAIVTAVGHLRADLSTPKLQTQDIGLRAHEILENAIQFELTGRTDAGSHTNLATIDANLTGTARTLSFIRPLLVGRDPHLGETERDLAAAQRLVKSFDHGGRWTPLDRLTRGQREALDARLEETVELLSQVAVITDPRKTAGETQ